MTLRASDQNFILIFETQFWDVSFGSYLMDVMKYRHDEGVEILKISDHYILLDQDIMQFLRLV